MQNFIILEIIDLAHFVLISYSKQNHLQFFMSLSKTKHQDLALVLVLELEMSFQKKNAQSYAAAVGQVLRGVTPSGSPGKLGMGGALQQGSGV